MCDHSPCRNHVDLVEPSHRVFARNPIHRTNFVEPSEEHTTHRIQKCPPCSRPTMFVTISHGARNLGGAPELSGGGTFFRPLPNTKSVEALLPPSRQPACVWCKTKPSNLVGVENITQSWRHGHVWQVKRLCNAALS